MNIYAITYHHADTGTTATANFRADTMEGALREFTDCVNRKVNEGQLRPTRRTITSVALVNPGMGL